MWFSHTTDKDIYHIRSEYTGIFIKTLAILKKLVYIKAMHKVFTCMNSLYPIFTKCINNFNLYGLHVVEGNAGHTFCMGE